MRSNRSAVAIAWAGVALVGGTGFAEVARTERKWAERHGLPDSPEE